MDDDLNVKVSLDDAVVAEIQNSAYYCAVVDEGFFESPLSIAEFLYARHICKPIGVALKKGVVLPMEWLSGADVFGVEEWDDRDMESIEVCANRLVEKYVGWRESKGIGQ